MTDVEILLQQVLKGSSVRNILADTEDMTSTPYPPSDPNSNWYAWHCALTPSASPAPDGTLTAFDLKEDDASTTVRYFYQEALWPHQPSGTFASSYKLLPNMPYTFAVCVAPADQNFVIIEFYSCHDAGDGAEHWIDARYDLTTGEMVTAFLTSAPPSFAITETQRPDTTQLGFIGQRMFPLANGFWRCELSVRTGSWPYIYDFTDFAISPAISLPYDSNWAYAGTGGTALRFWRPQLVRAPYLLDYAGTVGVNPAIDTRAETRVYPTLRPQGGGLPAITYQRYAEQSFGSLSGASSRDLVSVRIDCWAEKYSDARELMREVRAVMAAANLDGVLKNNPLSEIDDVDTELNVYHASGDFACWQK